MSLRGCLALALVGGGGCSILVSTRDLAGEPQAFEVSSDAADVGALDAGDADVGNADDGGDGDAGVLFADEFAGGALGADWALFGSGVWSVSSGEAKQQDTTQAVLAMIAVPQFASLRDYRVVARMRQLVPGSTGAMEIAFRVQMAGTNPMYICVWEPQSKYFAILRTNDGIALAASLAEFTASTPPTFTATSPITMEVTVKGSSLACRVLEIPAAQATVTDATLPSGTFGLKTYQIQTAFDYIRVYPVD